MKVKISYKLLVLISTAFVLVGCKEISSLFSKQSEEVSVQVGKSAPDFVLNDIDGKEHRLSQYRGKYVVLEWVNFDCPYVEKHYDSGNMQGLQAKYTQENVVWLSISSSAPGKQGNFTAKEIKKRSAKLSTGYTAYLLDNDGKVGRKYTAQTTPHMYIIDPQGKLIYQGAIDSNPSTDAEDIPKSVNYVALGLDEARQGKKLTHTSTVPYGCAVKY